ncbi:hypothetical protein, partial [Acinetobacter baumannii]|uniref:hypothetical protein n=1 Tax=Acinetobacter baumannii TaxID=470 RepID=UPI0005CFAF33
TTYPSYALNLAQLGALCISNLCATKPSLTIDDWNAAVLFRRALDIKQKLYQIKRFHRYAIFYLNLLNNYS